jgi:predicted GIY-YIG superfamily endonuclease
MTCGIYKLNFNGTDKTYIGLSDNIERRWNTHKHRLTNGLSPAKLQEAFNTFGLPELEILCECTQDELEKYEKEAMLIFDSISNGFNTRDGGSTGGGIGVSGANNGRAVYSDAQILHAFNLLVTTKLTLREIAEVTGTSVQAVSHISAGTGHTWIRNEYPEEYDKLTSSKRETRVSAFPINIINTSTAQVYTVTSYEDVQKLIPCAYTSAVSLVSGNVTSLFKVWKLEHPIIKSHVKKPTYTVKNKSTGEICSFSSKFRFFEEHNLVNRPKFTKFLNPENLGASYQNWELISVS